MKSLWVKSICVKSMCKGEKSLGEKSVQEAFLGEESLGEIRWTTWLSFPPFSGVYVALVCSMMFHVLRRFERGQLNVMFCISWIRSAQVGEPHGISR